MSMILSFITGTLDCSFEVGDSTPELACCSMCRNVRALLRQIGVFFLATIFFIFGALGCLLYLLTTCLLISEVRPSVKTPNHAPSFSINFHFDPLGEICCKNVDIPLKGGSFKFQTLKSGSQQVIEF